MSTGIKQGLKDITAKLISTGFKRFLPKAGEAAVRLSEVMQRKGLPPGITQKFVDTALSNLSGLDRSKVSKDLANLAIDEGHSLLKKGAGVIADKISEKHPAFRSEFLLPLKKKFKLVKAAFAQPPQHQLRVDEGNPKLENDFSNMKAPAKILESAVTHNNPLIPAVPIPPNTGPMFYNPKTWTINETLTQFKKRQKQVPSHRGKKPASDIAPKKPKVQEAALSKNKKPMKESGMSKGKKPASDIVSKKYLIEESPLAKEEKPRGKPKPLPKTKFLKETLEKKKIVKENPELISPKAMDVPLTKMRVAELRNYARELNVGNSSKIPISKMNKKQLQIAIRNRIKVNKRKFKTVI